MTLGLTIILEKIVDPGKFPNLIAKMLSFSLSEAHIFRIRKFA